MNNINNQNTNSGRNSNSSQSSQSPRGAEIRNLPTSNPQSANNIVRTVSVGGTIETIGTAYIHAGNNYWMKTADGNWVATRLGRSLVTNLGAASVADPLTDFLDGQDEHNDLVRKQRDAVNARQLVGKVVWINPGHNTVVVAQGGTSGTLNGVTHFERDLVLGISLQLRWMLIAEGATVHMSHTNINDALPNGQRVALINAASPDAAVSVHLDSDTNPNTRGFLVFHSTPHTPASHTAINTEFARDMLRAFEEMGSGLITNSNRVGPIRQHPSYYLFGNSNGPGINPSIPLVLIEAGFMSSPDELRYIVDNIREIARAIAQGIINFLK